MAGAANDQFGRRGGALIRWEVRVTQVMLAVGTKKGLFLGRVRPHDWTWEGPHQSMAAVAAVAIDTRRSPARLLVGGRNEHWGPAVFTSDDLGKYLARGAGGSIAFPPDTGAAVEQIWQLQPGPASRPDEVWAGVEPAALFRSDDGGRTFAWSRAVGPPAPPGLAPRRRWTLPAHGPATPDDAERASSWRSRPAVSTSPRTAERVWAPSNRGVGAVPARPDAGVRAVRAQGGARHRETQIVLVLQNHGGVFRSEDGGASGSPPRTGCRPTSGSGWRALRSGRRLLPLPAFRRHEPVPGDGRAGVFRSDDGVEPGDSSTGLPDTGFHSMVLRDALRRTTCDPVGVYFGTRSGEVWASADGGTELEQSPATCPTCCVFGGLVA